MSEALLSVRHLYTRFHTFDGVVQAVNDVSFEIEPRKALALVGETGCGKSVTAYSILRIIRPPGRVEGKVIFRGEDLLEKSETEMRRIRGNRISMMFQEPMTSLNPVFTIGQQLSMVLMEHKKISEKESLKVTLDAIHGVRIPDSERIAGQYPHQLSGGMRQRIMAAMALSLSPELIICDEPTTSIDVTLQAQILRLIKDLQTRLGASMLMITHNLGVVAHYCDRVAVMYAGSIVEIADVKTIFKESKHPYVKGLLGAIPTIAKKVEKLTSIPGTVPDLIHPPTGCRFHPRCEHAMNVCRQKVPPLVAIGDRHQVACYLYSKETEIGH